MENITWILVILLAVSIVLIVLFLGLKIRKLLHANKTLSRKVVSLQKMNPSEESLNYKLDPHLLKNALNTIQSHAYNSYYALDKLSNVLDYILYESDEQFVKLGDEVLFAHNLIEINRLKVSPLFDLHIRKKIDERSGEKLIAPFVTINPIENAFKHADTQSENSFISVVFEVVDGVFFMSVANKIQEVNTLKKSLGGLGNKTYQSRLKKLYGDDYKLTTMQKQGVYHVELKIKLQADA